MRRALVAYLILLMSATFLLGLLGGCEVAYFPECDYACDATGAPINLTGGGGNG